MVYLHIETNFTVRTALNLYASLLLMPFFPLLALYVRNSPSPRSCETFRTVASFYAEELLAHRQTAKQEDHPLLDVRCSSTRNLRTRHAVVTGAPTYHGLIQRNILNPWITHMGKMQVFWALKQIVPTHDTNLKVAQMKKTFSNGTLQESALPSA